VGVDQPKALRSPSRVSRPELERPQRHDRNHQAPGRGAILDHPERIVCTAGKASSTGRDQRFDLLAKGRERGDGSRLYVVPRGAPVIDRERDPQPVHSSGGSVLRAGVPPRDAKVEECPQIVDRLDRSRSRFLGQRRLQILTEIEELVLLAVGDGDGTKDAAEGAQARLELVSVGAVEYELRSGFGSPYPNQRPVGVKPPDRVEVVDRLG